MKLEFYQFKELYMPIIGIIFGELMMLHGDVYYALTIRLIILLAIIFKVITKEFKETKIILQNIVLLILLQLINMSTPRGDDIIKNYLLIYGVMILPILLIIKNLETKNFRKHFYYIIVTILIGTLSTIFDYRMLSAHHDVKDILYFNGNILVVFLLLLVSILFLLSETKYWNKIIDICTNSLIPVYIVIMISRIK